MTYYRPKDLAECISRYGDIQFAPDKRLYWPRAVDWVKGLFLPQGISKHLKNQGKPCERIFCNTDMHEPLFEAFDNVLTAGCESELKTFDGCYNVRYVRGSSSVLSLHSYAIAVDLNAATNPLGGMSSWSDAFVRCFTDVGFTWGGDFKARKDPMHFQWCGIPKSQLPHN